jgi:serine/threonine protein kinase
MKTARENPGQGLDETIAYEPNPDASGPEGAQGAHDMTSPRDKHRYTFSSGERPLEGYTIKRAIGRGGFGEVYYATSDAGKEVALKLITRNLEVERRGVVQCMNLKSPHLIAIHDLKSNEEGDSFVIMEYVNGPSLASILAQHPGGLPPDQIRLWLRGLVDGVAYLHDHGIVHRDLKPANLFLEEGVVKIGDYGLSKAITHSKGETGHSECVGTCHYMAPEMSTGKYQKPIDIYAIGVILYEMVTGRVPFDGESVGEVLMKHLTSRPDLSALTQPYKSIVERALAKDPNHRPARVHDMLLPGDAPREPAVRFIGDRTPPPADPKDDVLRIGMDEPVMYIGPDTKPPQPRRSPPAQGFHRWLWGASASRPAPRPAARPARPAPPPRPERRPPAPRPAPAVAARPATPPPPPAPPPTPPPLPSGRVRVAELATSMLVATPVAGLASALALPAFGAMGIDLPHDPQQLAFLFAMTLLGSWGALLPTKLWEGREVPPWTRRFVMMVIGLVVGLGGAALAAWTGMTPSPAVSAHDYFVYDTHAWRQVDPSLAGPAAFAGFFGLSYAVGPWNCLTARGRKGRFRFLPVFWTGLLSGLIGGALAVPQPWGLVVLSLVALVTQVVSPWNKAAADYARAVRRKVA